MAEMQLKVITPSKIVHDSTITSITAPSTEGELTILPKHQKLFTLLKEGIITYRSGSEEEYLAIGGGYLETDGKQVTILVSRAYGQDDINDELAEKAIAEAEKVLEETKDKQQQAEAIATIRRSQIDLKLLRKKRKAPANASNL